MFDPVMEEPGPARMTALIANARPAKRDRMLAAAGTVLLELARRGISRERAYELVQRNAMRAFHEQRDFKGLLLADSDVTALLPPADIEKAFDLDEQLQHVADVFARVFGS